ncbi:MerR family transcriptional regulator, partial [Clostridium polynesiense]|uniref:MerR family transcriptional regulator n=1 Tax=Clostridium polynesiense TaxID=1325933 RepID=UPI00164EB18B
IKAYMDKRSPEAFHRLLEDKQKQVDDKIAELKEIKNLLKMKQVQTGYLSEDISSIKIVHCKQKNYFITLVNENYVEAMIDHGKSLPHHLFNTELGTLTASSNLYKGIYNHTEGIFSNTGNKKSNHTRPEGNYIRAFHVGDFSDLTSTYERILDYCRKQDLELEGYAYELGINDLCIMRIEEYVTMIEIKIK